MIVQGIARVERLEDPGMSSGKLILVTNDDGIQADGIKALAESIRDLGSVVLVAPELEQSASSHSITLDKPLRIKQYAPDRFGVTGTPTDCVLLAVHRILSKNPDILISGINHGPNMGEDVIYSGTVAAAIEGYILRIPSIAISVASWDPVSFGDAAEAVHELLAQMLKLEGKQPNLWNVNIPAIPRNEIKGIAITKLGSRIYNDVIIEKKDPRGKEYFWIGGGEPGWSAGSDTDFAAVSAGYISVTPLRPEMTDYGSINGLREWITEWQRG
jgi:5'-nucleotidase